MADVAPGEHERGNGENGGGSENDRQCATHTEGRVHFKIPS